MKKLILLSLMVLFVFSALNADYFVKQETKTPSIMGQPATTVTQNLWIGDGVYANVTAAQTTIVDSKKKVMLIVYPSTKTYVEMKLPLDISKYIPEAAKGMIETMLKSMTIKVTPNGKKEKVKTWNTKGYTAIMSMKQMGMEFKINMDIAASTDVPFDWKKVATEFTGNMSQVGQQKMSSKIIDEMKKIEGYVVKMVMTMDMMGMKIRVENNVIEIAEKKAPAGTFVVPAGFKKVEKMTLKRRGM